MTAEALAIAALQAEAIALRRGLRSFRWRVRLLLTIRLGAIGVAATAGAGALAVLFVRSAGIWYPILLPEILLGVVLAIAAAVSLVWPLPDKLVAIAADRRLGLCDRLGSALEFARASIPSGMERAAVADALGHLGAARPRDALPFRMHRPVKAAGLCVAGLLLAQALPVPALLVSSQERREKAELQQEAMRIEPLAKQLEEIASEGGDAEAEEVARRLRKLAERLRRGQLTKKEALLELGDAERAIEKLADRLPVRTRTAQKAAEQLRKAAREDLASKAMALARQAAQSGDRSGAERLEHLAQRAQEAKSLAELTSLGRELGDQAAAMGMPLAVPPEVLASLAEAFSQTDLELSQEMLEKLADLSSSWTPAEPTQKELDALAEDIEALAKMLEGTELAELAEMLQKAADCLRAGDCQGAADHLRRCRSMLCLGGGCRACGDELSAILARLRGCRLASPVRKPGGGYGQCKGGNADQPFIPPNAPAATLHFPRRTATRGVLEHVRTQVRPQGEMLVTTEKGVPLDGATSSVPYYEIVSDYSQAAEAALSREDVPPTYRTTVREYFRALQSGASP